MKTFNENDAGKSFRISVSNSMGSDEVTVNVKAIVDLIITPPAKTTYQLFDELNLDGMKVYGVYDDETVEEIFNYSVNDSDFNNNIELEDVDISYELRYNENIDTFGFNFSQDLFKNNFLINKIKLSVGDLTLTKNLFENLICLNDINISAIKNKSVVLNEDLLEDNININRIYLYNIETLSQSFISKIIELKHFISNGSFNLIPIDFFNNNLKLEIADFNSTEIVFIPTNLFDNNINLKSFDFGNCRKLLSIPENLFINNINLELCAYGFYNCKNISLPTNLFNAAAIQNKKPEFYCCFAVTNSADSPIGASYPLWNNITLTSRNYCYQNCSGLTDFGTIPLYWK